VLRPEKNIQVNVGALGLVTRLKFRITPQRAIRRDVLDLKFPEFAAQVRSISKCLMYRIDMNICMTR
jgi:hypothetical protein